jgi:hypothetical protein
MSGSSRLRVLAIASLFPTNVDPTYAPFNRLQFSALAESADVSVVGVVSWRFGRWYARDSSRDVVRDEIVDSLRVVHPRSLDPGVSLPARGDALETRGRRSNGPTLGHKNPEGHGTMPLARMRRHLI